MDPETGLSRRRSPNSESLAAIRKFLAACVSIYQVKETLSDEAIRLWLARFGEFDAAVLNAAFAHCLDHCKYFPVFADMLGAIQKPQAAAEAIAAETAWEAGMNWLARWWHPDLGVCRGAPTLDEKIRRAMLAAGGFTHLNECPEEELQWAKKRFTSAFSDLVEVEHAGLLIENSPAAGLLDSMRDELAKTCKPIPILLGPVRNNIADRDDLVEAIRKNPTIGHTSPGPRLVLQSAPENETDAEFAERKRKMLAGFGDYLARGKGA